MGIKSKYKEENPLEKRLKMIEEHKVEVFIKFRKDDQVLLVIERDPKCKIYPNLPKNVFIVRKSQKIIEVYNTIRKKISNIGKIFDLFLEKKYENYSLFIFTDSRILNKGEEILNLDFTIGQLYEKEKDKEDGFLYIYYSDMEPF